jgi:APA family basic amino acid/polyamine antiporter
VGLSFYGIGSVIGAGIYSVIGPAAGVAGHGLWLSFLLAAFAAGLTGLSYAELASAIPRAGAEYRYTLRAFPKARLLAASVGLLVAITGAATAATVALAFGGYLRVLIDVPVPVSAVTLLAVCLGFNIWGIGPSNRLNIVLTLIEMAGLVIVIALGAGAPSFGTLHFETPLPAVIAGAGMVFFVYIGFEGVANLAEEVRKPSRNVPLAILVSIVVTTILYVLVALAVEALATPAALAQSGSPLSLAVGTRAPALSPALAVIALVSTANTALIGFIVAARVLYGLGDGGDIPRFFARLQRKRRTPWIAALALFVLAVLLLPLGGVETIASVTSLVAILVFVVVNAALIALRLRAPDLERPFRVPLSIANIPLPCVIGIVVSLALLGEFTRTVYLAGLGLALLVAVLVLVRRLRLRR